jgi:UDP-N-acetylglucosamine 2-epimerase (non-hydrolysing)
VHLNPNVLSLVQAKLGNHPQIKLEKPLNYPEFAAYMQASDLLLTDSGGVQEEAPYFKKPIFVMRESTERPEGIDAGVAALVGSDTDKIFSLVSKALTDAHYYASFQKAVNPYGDGHASEKILTLLGFTQK